jgi:hypothetical protein
MPLLLPSPAGMPPEILKMFEPGFNIPFAVSAHKQRPPKPMPLVSAYLDQFEPKVRALSFQLPPPLLFLFVAHRIDSCSSTGLNGCSSCSSFPLAIP